MKARYRGLVLTLVAAGAVSGAEARVRAMGFGFAQMSSDSINASAHGKDCQVLGIVDNDGGDMTYEATIDPRMLDQLAAVTGVGGTATIVFTLRTGLSFVGNGSGQVSGQVDVSVDGRTVASIGDGGGGSQSGTTSTRHEIPLDADTIAGLVDGGTIRVSATGSGEAHSNGCRNIDQAIVSWYFTNGGKPYLATSPW